MDEEKTVSDLSATKKVIEYKVIDSDRGMMVHQASRFVESMRGEGYATMTDLELSTYNAALEFLHRQFSDGFKDSETVQTRVELEISG